MHWKCAGSQSTSTMHFVPTVSFLCWVFLSALRWKATVSAVCLNLVRHGHGAILERIHASLSFRKSAANMAMQLHQRLRKHVIQTDPEPLHRRGLAVERMTDRWPIDVQRSDL